MICPNCNHNNPEGSKYCEECGTKLPEPKKVCPSCGTVLSGSPKFCSECGYKLGTGQKVGPSGVSIGDKNVIAGDLNVVGRKEEFNVSGNATIIRHEDDTKKIETCLICGKSYFRINGRYCKSCGRYVCSDCYDENRHMCMDCRKREIEESESKYRQALEEVLSDGKIDKDEAGRLNDLRNRLGISFSRAKELEAFAKENTGGDTLSSIDETNLDKAVSLFIDEKESESFGIAKELYSHHQGNEKVSRVYYLSGAATGSKEVFEKVKGVEYDVPLKYVVLFLYYCHGSEFAMADKEIQRACSLWPDNVVIRSCEIILLRKAIEKEFSERVAEDIKKKISLLPENCEDQIEAYFIERARRTFIEEADSILFNEEAFKDDVVSTGRMVFDFSISEENRKKYIHQEYASQAYDLYRQSMYAGSEVALFRMAICHALGCGVKQSADKAIEFLNKASEAGYSLAFTRLGDCYQWGRGVETDYSKAEELYKKATELGDAIAPNNLGCLYEFRTDSSQEDKHKAFEYYSICAHQGLPQGQYNLGKMYFKGIGVEVDEVEAVKWFTKAAEQGFCESQKKLAECYKEGCGVERDYAESFRWYSLAAESGDMDAQFCLACAFFDGEGIEEDQEKAVFWVRKAAEQGDSDAQLFLGECYRDGDGIEQDYSEAAKWLMKSAEKGNASAQFELGYMYCSGVGLEQDLLLADKWIRMAAEQGDPEYQYLYGHMLDTGFAMSCSRDGEKALEWFQKAADQGYVAAYLRLAQTYDELYEDDDENDDYAKNAFDWYLKCAESELDDVDDCSEAEYHVAIGFFEGRGVEKNREIALTWFTKATEHGSYEACKWLRTFIKDASEEETHIVFDCLMTQAKKNDEACMCAVAECFSFGRGVTLNYETAIDWYIKAALNDSSEAVWRLESLDGASGHKRWVDEDDEEPSIDELGIEEMKKHFFDEIVSFDNRRIEEMITANYDFGFYIVKKMEELLSTGKKLLVDVDSFRDWIKNKTKTDYRFAIRLAELLYKGKLFEKDIEESMKWFSRGYEKMSEAGEGYDSLPLKKETKPLMWDLGIELIDESRIPDNERKAYEWLKKVVDIDCSEDEDDEYGQMDNKLYYRWFGELLFWGYLGDIYESDDYYQNKLKELEEAKKVGEDSVQWFCANEDLYNSDTIEKGKHLLSALYIDKVEEKALYYLERGSINNYSHLIELGYKLIDSPLYDEIKDATKKAVEFFVLATSSKDIESDDKGFFFFSRLVRRLYCSTLKPKWNTTAVLYLEKQISIFESLADDEYDYEKHIFFSEITLGILYYENEKYDKAFSILSNASTKGESVEAEALAGEFNSGIDGDPVSFIIGVYKGTLGKMYYYGRGTEKNYDKAFPILKKAADEYENRSAMVIVGNCYMFGHGTLKDDELAFKYALDMAEKSKDGEDEYYVGRCYDEGLRGRKKNHKLAQEWFKKAAEHGSEKAKNKLESSGLFSRFKKK